MDSKTCFAYSITDTSLIDTNCDTDFLIVSQNGTCPIWVWIVLWNLEMQFHEKTNFISLKTNYFFSYLDTWHDDFYRQSGQPHLSKIQIYLILIYVFVRAQKLKNLIGRIRLTIESRMFWAIRCTWVILVLTYYLWLSLSSIGTTELAISRQINCVLIQNLQNKFFEKLIS